MAKKVSRNSPCPCGSGKKYKHCCIRKEFDWVEMDDGQIGRRVQLPDEVTSIFEELRVSQRMHLGHEPELLFEGAPPLEHLEHWTVEAMKKAGVEPALIYAYENTGGLLINAYNENKVPDNDIAEWEATIDEYEKKTGRKAARRRLNDQDFDAMMRNGPKERAPSADFVKRLPLSPPFSKEDWGKRHMTDVVNSPEIIEYLESCLAEVTRSGRSKTYLNMFCMMAHLGGPPGSDQNLDIVLMESLDQNFSVEQLNRALRSLALTGQPKGALPCAAAAFEFLLRAVQNGGAGRPNLVALGRQVLQGVAV